MINDLYIYQLAFRSCGLTEEEAEQKEENGEHPDDLLFEKLGVDLEQFVNVASALIKFAHISAIGCCFVDHETKHIIAVPKKIQEGQACSIPVKTKPLIDVANYNYLKGKKTPHTVRAKEKRVCGCRELI